MLIVTCLKKIFLKKKTISKLTFIDTPLFKKIAAMARIDRILQVLKGVFEALELTYK